MIDNSIMIINIFNRVRIIFSKVEQKHKYIHIQGIIYKLIVRVEKKSVQFGQIRVKSVKIDYGMMVTFNTFK